MKLLCPLPWILLFSCAIALQSHAGNVFYVDPINGSANGDGSDDNPWGTLQAVFDAGLIQSREPQTFPYVAGGPLVVKNPGAQVKAGDTIRLRNGFHGSVFGRGYFNSDYVTIEAEAGHSPSLERFHLQGGENWKLKGLAISPEFAGVTNNNSIVRLESHSYHGPISNITLEDSTIFSTTDSTSWSAADWNSRAGNGVDVNGSDIVIRNNQIKNVHFGVNTLGDDILAESNTIENYSGDGMRGGGDRVTFQYNTIKWSYDVDANHDDAIQFFRPGGVANRDVILRGNAIFGYADPAHPLTHGPQGIGNFDGPYVDWLVENNLVMVANYHGISLFGAENARITNNTVLDITGELDSWIKLDNSTGGVVRNNLSANFQLTGANGLTNDHNLLLDEDNLDAIFRDWQNGDLRLKSGSPAIDIGSGDLTPTIDIRQRPRPIGDAADLGAFEFTLDADFDSDRDADGADFLRWQRGFGKPSQALPADGDADGDETVDSDDLGFWESDFSSDQGNGNLSQVASLSLPEPSTASLLLSALATLCFRR